MIGKLLIAQPGELAARIARTCKRLGVTSVAVAEAADVESPYVQACDEHAVVTRARPLDPTEAIEVAKSVGADAITYGTSRSSLDIRVVDAAKAAGLVVVGPAPETLTRVLDRTALRRNIREGDAMRTLPHMALDEDLLASAHRAAEITEYPLEIRAVALTDAATHAAAFSADELEKALTVAREMQARDSIGGGLYAERHVERPRFVAVDWIADRAGEVACLGDRETSIRTGGRVWLSEAPAPAVSSATQPDWVREALIETTQRTVRHLGLTGVGAIEFVFDRRGRFALWDVHAGIAVDHAVGELATGVDLVEWAIRLASGDQVPVELLCLVPAGAAVSATLLAEPGPTDPAVSTITELRFPPFTSGRFRIETEHTPGTRVGPRRPVDNGGDSSRDDDLIARFAAYGATRRHALLLLDRAIAETHVAPMKTNAAVLRRALGHDAFRAGQYDASFLRRSVGHGTTAPAAAPAH